MLRIFRGLVPSCDFITMLLKVHFDIANSLLPNEAHRRSRNDGTE